MAQRLVLAHCKSCENGCKKSVTLQNFMIELLLLKF